MGKGEEGGVRTDRFNTLLVFASIPLRLSSREKKKNRKTKNSSVTICGHNNLSPIISNLTDNRGLRRIFWTSCYL